MKVKDYIGWLQSSKWINSGPNMGFMWHYYPNKSKSACGKSSHPRTQFDAAYVIGTDCKACKTYCRKHGISCR